MEYACTAFHHDELESVTRDINLIGLVERRRAISSQLFADIISNQYHKLRLSYPRQSRVLRP